MGRLAVGVRFTRYGKVDLMGFFGAGDEEEEGLDTESGADAADCAEGVELDVAVVERKRCRVEALGRARGRRNGRYIEVIVGVSAIKN
jgi:hypothetical protein